MAVEFESTREERECSKEHFITDQIVRSQAYQDALARNTRIYLESGPPDSWSKVDTLPNIPEVSDLISHVSLESQTFPTTDTYFQTQLSALEIATDFPQVNEQILTQGQAIANIRGNVGHAITTYFNDITRQVRAHNKIIDIVASQTGLDQTAKEVVLRATDDLTSRYKQLRLSDVPEFTREIWERIRREYIFVSKVPRSKRALMEGRVFKSAQVASWWNSTQQKTFEGELFMTLQNRRHLPIESSPRHLLTSEKKMTRNMEILKDYLKTQFTWHNVFSTLAW